MTTPDSVQQDDIVSVWDKVATSYDFTHYWANEVHQAWFRVLLSVIGDPGGKSLLEVGCGSGFQSLALAEEGARVALLDISRSALDAASSTFIRRGLPSPPCFMTDALQSGIPDHSYDVVWNMGVIEHFSDDGKRRLIREMSRMTKPGGLTVIMVPNSRCWPFQIAQMLLKVRGAWPYGEEDDITPSRLETLCRQAGIQGCKAFAFDPLSGWFWLPFIGPVLRKRCRIRGVGRLTEKSAFGWMTIGAIPKR